jgi:hypothetical protein
VTNSSSRACYDLPIRRDQPRAEMSPISGLTGQARRGSGGLHFARNPLTAKPREIPQFTIMCLILLVNHLTSKQ